AIIVKPVPGASALIAGNPTPGPSRMFTSFTDKMLPRMGGVRVGDGVSDGVGGIGVSDGVRVEVGSGVLLGIGVAVKRGVMLTMGASVLVGIGVSATCPISQAASNSSPLRRKNERNRLIGTQVISVTVVLTLPA